MRLTHTIKKPIGTVFEYLSYMQKFVTVHPIIFKIEEKGENNYLVFEKLKILFIPITFTYPIKVQANLKNQQVIISALVKKIIHITIFFQLEAEGDKTKINEIINFKSYLPISLIMKSIFKKQHAILFKNIENLN
jgi:carbon monoxide dehydrogenase subunit G